MSQGTYQPSIAALGGEGQVSPSALSFPGQTRGTATHLHSGLAQRSLARLRAPTMSPFL